jgi:multidrug efflux pump subunit AcrA (membrane-fusion protein)
MGQALAHLIDPRSMQVEYQVPSQDGDKVKLNQHIKFFINDHSKPYDGIVSYISPLYNNKNYNLVLRANISNVSSLKPNLFGSVIEITDLHYKALAIPQLLVQADAQGFYVYTVDESRVTKNYIKTGSINKKGLIEIKSGIAPNALIISSNIEDLTVGQAVKVAGR